MRRLSGTKRVTRAALRVAAGLAVLLCAAWAVNACADFMTGELLVNGQFLEWTDNALVGWKWSKPPTIGMESENYKDLAVLRIECAGNALFQQFESPPVHAGDLLAFEFEFKGAEPDVVMVDIDLRYGADAAKRVMNREKPAGDDQWHTVRVETIVPFEGATSLQFTIHIKPEAKKPIYVSNARATLLPAV